MFKRIVVGVDESETSRAALRAAADIARHYDALVVLVYAYGPLPRYLGAELYDNAAAKAIMHGEDLLAEAVATVEEVPAETDLLEGPAAEALLRAAEVRRADLIVIGSRGLGEISGLALGSVGHKLIQRARIPVLIVKHLPDEA
ncbi:MAG: universal stress protein [Ardenticatenaceae bacterium]|nr:universal stress protein [Ardenticatenaceae bacterium]